MIKEIRIKNFKSVQKLKLELGRVNVFIGENGCGKSNILEAIAMASASASGKLDNEFLTSRGIRVTQPQMMRSAFDKEQTRESIQLFVFGEKEEEKFESELSHNNDYLDKWKDLKKIEEFAEKKMLSQFRSLIGQQIDDKNKSQFNKTYETFEKTLNHMIEYLNSEEINALNLQGFLIYSPENTALRMFEKEGQILPLGIRGEGLFKLLKFLNQKENKTALEKIKENLRFLDWFEDFDIPTDLYATETRLKIIDRFLDPALDIFDQKSANEGFLFLLFYITLFVSEETPKFFAIDNIDASLNPKLCRELIKILTKLAKEHNKQVIFTTHNPAILDGLNLNDDEQRLFVIRRNVEGHTKADRYIKPRLIEGEKPVPLSVMFMRGYIGGLPKNF